jgi:hypothetical protein
MFAVVLAGLLAGLFAAALLLASPQPALAQDAAELRQRVTSAVAAARMAEDSLKALRLVTRADIPPDSFVAGSIMIRYDAHAVNARELDALKTGAERAHATVQAFIGDGARAVESAKPLIAESARGKLLATRRWMSLYPEGAVARNVQTNIPITAGWVAEGILDLLGTLAAPQAPDSLRSWSGGWVPVRANPESWWQRAAIDMATSNSSVTRVCYAGSIGQCASALGLTPVRDSLTEWYAPEDRRVLVSLWKPDTLDAPAQHLWKDCIDGRVVASCDQLARWRVIPIPLAGMTRLTLLDFAVAQGGPGAYSRMLGAHGSALDVLARTAGIPGDTLIARWRAKVLGAAPREARPRLLEVLLAVAWTIIFAALSVRRRP